MSDDRMLPQVNWDAIQTEIWRRHAKELRALLDHQNKTLYEVAHDRDLKLMKRKARKTMNTKPTPYKILPKSEFKSKYPDANLESDELEFIGVGPGAQTAEVQVPGYGYHACLVQDGKPLVFHSEDDGWQECPTIAEYVQI